MDRLAEQAMASISVLQREEVYGRVTKILGLLVEIAGFGAGLSIGSMVRLRPHGRPDVPCEVVGFREGHALLMPFGTLEGVGLGCRAVIQDQMPVITAAR
jgi:flagellum-specific ATP synthase